MTDLDEKDRILLNLLQEDCRMSLTKMSEYVNLSTDSAELVLKKLKRYHTHIKVLT